LRVLGRLRKSVAVVARGPVDGIRLEREIIMSVVTGLESRIKRPIIPQPFYPFKLTVGVIPTALATASQQSSIAKRVDAIILSLAAIAANPVYLGGPNVVVPGALGVNINGLEIRPGVPVQLSIKNERQLYEVQAPLIDVACRDAEEIPFVAWPVDQMFLIAAGPTDLGVILFPAAFL
jgi:hypothetical protein